MPSPTNSARALIAAAALLTPAIVCAQAGAPATLRGDVRTSDGVGIVGAEVWLVGTRSAGDSSIAATTNEAGSFKFTLPLHPGSTLLVRRRGFGDVRLPLPTDAATRRTTTVPAVTLAASIAPSFTVVVRDTGAFAGVKGMLFRHMAARRGEFVTRADLARMGAIRTSSLLRGMRGVQLVSGRNGGTYVRLRNRNCLAPVWLDGASMGVGAFDVDNMAPQALTAIEVFADPSSVPSEYQTLESMACGAIAFWTRRGDEDGQLAFEAPSVADPSAVRLASQVDAPARVIDSVGFAPRYPGEARAGGRGGAVLVELVVDTLGQVERLSSGIVAASAPDARGPGAERARAATLPAGDVRRPAGAPARAPRRPFRALRGPPPAALTGRRRAAALSRRAAVRLRVRDRRRGLEHELEALDDLLPDGLPGADRGAEAHPRRGIADRRGEQRVRRADHVERAALDAAQRIDHELDRDPPLHAADPQLLGVERRRGLGLAHDLAVDVHGLVDVLVADGRRVRGGGRGEVLLRLRQRPAVAAAAPEGEPDRLADAGDRLLDHAPPDRHPGHAVLRELLARRLGARQHRHEEDHLVHRPVVRHARGEPEDRRHHEERVQRQARREPARDIRDGATPARDRGERQRAHVVGSRRTGRDVGPTRRGV